MSCPDDPRRRAKKIPPALARMITIRTTSLRQMCGSGQVKTKMRHVAAPRISGVERQEAVPIFPFCPPWQARFGERLLLSFVSAIVSRASM